MPPQVYFNPRYQLSHMFNYSVIYLKFDDLTFAGITPYLWILTMRYMVKTPYLYQCMIMLFLTNNSPVYLIYCIDFIFCIHVTCLQITGEYIGDSRSPVIGMHPRDACKCSPESRRRRSQGFVNAISQKPLIRIARDFVSRHCTCLAVKCFGLNSAS